MDFYGRFFNYAGVDSSLYNLIFVSVESQRNMKISGDIGVRSMFNNKSNRSYFVDNDFESSPIQFEIEVVRSDASCIDLDKKDIERWLFNRSGYYRLSLGRNFDGSCTGADSAEYVMCTFRNPSVIENASGVIGYRATMICDSATGYEDIESVINVGNADQDASKMITVMCGSDIDDYVYPKVTIEMGVAGGDIVIVNNSDSNSRLTSFIGLSPSVTMIMSGNGANYVSGGNYTKFKDRNFVRLKRGVNNITITGNVKSIKLEFSNRIYI